MTTTKKAAKPKKKKLTAKHVDNLKAGYPHCSKSDCIGGTCGGQKSWDYCTGDGNKDKTLNVAMSAAASGRSKG